MNKLELKKELKKLNALIQPLGKEFINTPTVILYKGMKYSESALMELNFIKKHAGKRIVILLFNLALLDWLDSNILDADLFLDINFVSEKLKLLEDDNFGEILFDISQDTITALAPESCIYGTKRDGTAIGFWTE